MLNYYLLRIILIPINKCWNGNIDPTEVFSQSNALSVNEDSMKDECRDVCNIDKKTQRPITAYTHSTLEKLKLCCFFAQFDRQFLEWFLFHYMIVNNTFVRWNILVILFRLSSITNWQMSLKYSSTRWHKSSLLYCNSSKHRQDDLNWFRVSCFT